MGFQKSNRTRDWNYRLYRHLFKIYRHLRILFALYFLDWTIHWWLIHWFQFCFEFRLKIKDCSCLLQANESNDWRILSNKIMNKWTRLILSPTKIVFFEMKNNQNIGKKFLNLNTLLPLTKYKKCTFHQKWI